MPTHFQGSEATVRALNAYINLVRASDSVLSKIGTHLESEGVTTGQFAVLEALLHLGPMCQHVLAEKLLRSGGNMTLVVDNLQKQGWVKRERQEKDRRVVANSSNAQRKTVDHADIPGARQSHRAGDE